MRNRLTFLTTRFGQRMFLLFAGCALVPIVALALISYGSVNHELREQAANRLADTSKSMAMGIWERLTILDSELQIVAVELESAASHRIQKPRSLLGEEVASRFRGIAVVARGSAPRTLHGAAIHPPQLERDDQAHLDSDQPLLEIVDVEIGEPRILLGRRSIDAAGAAVTVWGEIRPSFLWWGGVEENTLPAGIELVVLDRSRAHAIHDTLGPHSTIDQAFLEQVSEGSHHSFTWQREDIDLLSHYRVVSLRPAFFYPALTLVVSEPEALVLRPLAVFKRSFLAVLLATLLIVMLVSIRQIRSALVPLERLQAGTRRLAAGDLGSSVEVESDDEFAELARSFNTMARNLDRQFATLSSLNQLQQAVLSTLDTDRIASTVLDRFGRIFPCERVAVVLMKSGYDGEGWLYAQATPPDRGRQVGAVELSPREMGALDANRDHVEWGMSGSATSFFQAPIDAVLETVIAFPVYLKDELVAVVAAGVAKEGDDLDPRDFSLARQLADQVAVALSNVRLIQQLDDLNWGTLSALARAIDVRSNWTKGHTDRVTTLAQQIGRSLGLSDARLDVLQRGSLLHDIGKIGVPSEVLDKPGALSPAEMDQVREHVRLGVRIIEPIPALSGALPVVLQHHEWFDGEGYPAGLMGSEICLEARILSVADCYDALRSDRPYRGAVSHAEVVDYIRQGSGKQFDPRVVEVFLQIIVDPGRSQTRGSSDSESELSRLAI